MARNVRGVIVVTDTSVVLNLSWLGEERLLTDLFGQVLAPSAVRDEFERLAGADSRFRGLVFPSVICVEDPTEIPDALASNEDLDVGEIHALALALERGIRHVLIDELAGRTAAISLGLAPSGLLGLPVEAKKRSLIPEVLPFLDRLRDDARFRIADDLRQRIAVLANESPEERNPSGEQG
jgi:predicted nucleic acid-binding protein